jgi:hypothetical protein
MDANKLKVKHIRDHFEKVAPVELIGEELRADVGQDSGAPPKVQSNCVNKKYRFYIFLIELP